MANDAAPADARTMLQMITGYWVSQAIRAVADLSIADHIHRDGALSAKEIAVRENSDPEMTFRLMRACAALGLLTYEGGLFRGTSLLDTLRAGAPNSVREVALVLTAPGHWLTWGRFPEAIRTGTGQAPDALGMPIFDYLGRHPEEAELFSGAMTNFSTPVIAECVPLIDTTGVEVVADIGCAHAAFVIEVLRRNRSVRGIAFDLPHIVQGATADIAAAGLTDRIEVAGGDFFESVPGSDLYLLKFVLHDWDDADCVQILRNCRAALRPGGRIAVVEMLIGAVGEPGVAPLMDINMLAVTGGRERDLAAFDRLFAEAGLRRSKMTALQTPYAVIEAISAS